jgi:hypothetical protein
MGHARAATAPRERGSAPDTAVWATKQVRALIDRRLMLCRGNVDPDACVISQM